MRYTIMGRGFVMNREQSFYSRSPMRAGIPLTYAVIKGACGDNCDAKLIDVDCDAFGHGIYPAIIVVKKTAGGGECQLSYTDLSFIRN